MCRPLQTEASVGYGKAAIPLAVVPSKHDMRCRSFGLVATRPSVA
jgi:hypothetical protein